MKIFLSTDCSLKFESMKLESLVIADQHAAVNILMTVHTPPKSDRSHVVL